jgi:hypothetical protein
MEPKSEPWQQWSGMSRKQQKLLNAACGDLADQLPWRYSGSFVRLSKDQWRHLISGHVIGAKFVDGIESGLVSLGRSSLELEDKDAIDAITLAFAIGDDPEGFGLVGRDRVEWCRVIQLARGISPNDETMAEQYA